MLSPCDVTRPSRSQAGRERKRGCEGEREGRADGMARGWTTVSLLMAFTPYTRVRRWYVGVHLGAEEAGLQETLFQLSFSTRRQLVRRVSPLSPCTH